MISLALGDYTGIMVVGFSCSNGSVSGIACDGYLCVKMGACDHTHKWTARAMSASG